MPVKHAARIDVVKCEDKEPKVLAFIRTCVAQASNSSTSCDVVARSVDSPVVQAVLKVIDEMGADRLSVRLVLSPDVEPRRALKMPFAEVRVAKRPRLIDAHEQLSMGELGTWVGDCMRRDPAERDAFEWYSSGCATSSTRAKRAFDRLWTLSDRLGHGTSAVAGMDAMPLQQATPAVERMSFREPQPTPSGASTRH